MTTLKITKKHHRHLNNPFPGNPNSLPFIQGTLFPNPQAIPSHQIFPIGNDFQLTWRSENGGSLSISHQSQPTRPIWSTIPGQAFVSTAMAETEIEESRGSFIIKDRNIQLVCNHQTIEEIRVINLGSVSLQSKDHALLYPYGGFDSKTELMNTHSPVLLITGRIFNVKRKKNKMPVSGMFVEKEVSTSAKYSVLFDQKDSNQIGFQVRLGKPNLGSPQRLSPRSYRGFAKKWGRTRRLRVQVSRLFSRRKGFTTVSSAEEENVAMKAAGTADFNRICLTYASERKERFFGFGEQFSHMDLKGKRVPIFVQEQGIGRGDQPITFAANLVSYRAGGDWSTTYAPSPFYMTSKMRSLYLDGYNYSVFDLTRHDRVQIQIHGDFVKGRILHGNSPSELIEQFTEAIGRPPTLPEWIISGAVVGMQGGTDTVRHVWDELQTHDVPISAFWLQDWVGQRKTVIGSQLWWNWEVDRTRYWGWQQLTKDLSAQHIKVMTYCNPCLAMMDTKPDVKRNLFEEAKKLEILVRDKNGEPYMVPNTAFDVGMLDFTHPRTASWFKKILQEMVDDGVRGWMADFGEGLPVDACLYSGEDPVSAHNRYPELWAKINREFVEEWQSSLVGKDREDPAEALVFFMRAGFRDSPKWAMLFWEGDQMGNKPSLNSQFYSNQKTLSHFARFAKVYKAWKFYRVQLVKEASQKGLPVCRHLFLHYPNDEHVHTLTYQQFLVGTEFLVVPVLDKGKNDVKAYFPIGETCSWKHIWTGNLYTKQGSEAWVEAPIGCPAIFVKDGSAIGDTFINNLRENKLL